MIGENREKGDPSEAFEFQRLSPYGERENELTKDRGENQD